MAELTAEQIATQHPKPEEVTSRVSAILAAVAPTPQQVSAKVSAQMSASGLTPQQINSLTPAEVSSRVSQLLASTAMSSNLSPRQVSACVSEQLQSAGLTSQQINSNHPTSEQLSTRVSAALVTAVVTGGLTPQEVPSIHVSEHGHSLGTPEIVPQVVVSADLADLTIVHEPEDKSAQLALAGLQEEILIESGITEEEIERANHHELVIAALTPEQLQAAGLPAEQLARLHSPRLSLAALTPDQLVTSGMTDHRDEELEHEMEPAALTAHNLSSAGLSPEMLHQTRSSHLTLAIVTPEERAAAGLQAETNTPKLALAALTPEQMERAMSPDVVAKVREEMQHAAEHAQPSSEPATPHDRSPARTPPRQATPDTSGSEGGSSKHKLRLTLVEIRPFTQPEQLNF